MKHFDIYELCYSWTAEHNGINNAPNKTETDHLHEMVNNLLDPFREYLGMPITVTSGFRCEQLNELVGGSKTSAHRVGYAADIQVRDMHYTELQTALLRFCQERNIKYDQIFSESSKTAEWVHVGYKNQQGEQRMQFGNWIKA